MTRRIPRERLSQVQTIATVALALVGALLLGQPTPGVAADGPLSFDALDLGIVTLSAASVASGQAQAR